jgi:hypothetical protein
MHQPRAARSLFFLALFALPVALYGCGGCRKEETRWDEAQQRSSENRQAVSKESEKGGSFNKFFPKQAAPFDIVYKQEKTGYAEASLKESGKEVATLSISDTVNNPTARDKFKSSTEQLGGFPAVAKGSMAMTALVADRYQVQVASKAPSFGKDDQKAWIEKFDLNGLAQLK